MESSQTIINYLKSNNLDKFSYTILILGKLGEEIVNQIQKKIENINKKSMDSFKKKNINDRLYSLKIRIDNSFKSDSIINSIIFVDKDIKIFNLTKKDVKFCNEWNFSKLMFITNGTDLDDFGSEIYVATLNFISELITENKVKTIFKFEKSNFSIIKQDLTKNKIIESNTSSDDIVSTKINQFKPILLYGLNPLLKKLTATNVIVEHKNLSKNEIFDIINKFEINQNQMKFKNIILDNITNPSYDEKILFGPKEVSWGLSNYMVKQLFINPKLLSKFKESDESRELINNIDVIIIQPLEPGDYGQILNKNYSGTVALKYY